MMNVLVFEVLNGFPGDKKQAKYCEIIPETDECNEPGRNFWKGPTPAHHDRAVILTEPTSAAPASTKNYFMFFTEPYTKPGIIRDLSKSAAPILKCHL